MHTSSSWSLARRILALQAIVLIVVLVAVLVALYFDTSAQTESTAGDRVIAVASTVAAAPSVRAAVTASYPAGQEISGPSAAMQTYANDVKTAELGVPEELITAHGAVSAEVAEAMAAGVRGRLGVDVGIAVTGVAGPGGGTQEKPVGLVHFHVDAPGAVEGRSFSLPGDRATIRSRATVSALHLARRVLTRGRHEGT